MYKLIQLNPLDKNTRKPPESIDVGFEAKQKPSTKELEFKKEAREFPAHLLSYLFENSPLKYAIIRSAHLSKPTLFGKSVEEKLLPKSRGNHPPKVGLYWQNFW